jgi:DNA-binding PadR family transcriptional regulator
VTPRRLRSPLAVVVLGMLAEEALHPYGMRQRVTERAYDRMPGVRATSLYDVVRRLADAGLIQADATAREGNRPERTRYTITPAGLEALTAWVGEVLADETDPDGLSAALSFMYALGRDQVVLRLRARANRLAAAIDADGAELARAEGDGMNPIFLSEHRYQLARRRAERDWIAGFLTDLENGDLAWPPG